MRSYPRVLHDVDEFFRRIHERRTRNATHRTTLERIRVAVEEIVDGIGVGTRALLVNEGAIGRHGEISVASTADVAAGIG